MASETAGCAGLLADLAQEYEKSRALLEQLEFSLKERTNVHMVAAPVELNVLPTQLETEEHEEHDSEDANEALSPSKKDAAYATRKTAGLKARLSSFFTRNRSQSLRQFETAGVEEPQPRVSVVNLNGPIAATPEEPKRSLILHPSVANGALQPTSALMRQSPRTSVETGKLQQADMQDWSASTRLSTSNLGGLHSSIRSRRSIDPFPVSSRRMSLETSKTFRSTNSGAQTNFESVAASRTSNGQLSLYGTSPIGATPINISSPWQQQQQIQLLLQESICSGSMSSGQLMMGREDTAIRRRSASRRGSDHASNPGISRGFSFNACNQPGSPVGSNNSPSHSGLLLGTSLTASLPTLGPTASSRSMLFNSSSNQRPLSMSAMAVVTPLGTDEQPDGLGGLGSTERTRCAVSATGMVDPIPATAANAAAAAVVPAAGSLLTVDIVPQLPQLPVRSRSLHESLPSSPVVGGGSPKTAATGIEPRRLQSFRFADGRETVPMLAAPEMGLQHCNAAQAKDLVEVPALKNAFRGTMHLI